MMIRVFVTLAIGLIFSISSQAQVLLCDFFKVQVFEQTSNNTMPSTPLVYVADGAVEPTSAGDYSGVTINTIHPYSFDGFEWYFQNQYASKALLDADFPPASSVVVALAAGTQPSASENIPIGADDYPTSPPYLTGTSYDDLQGLDTTQSIQIDFVTPGSAGADGGSFEIIEDPNGAETPISEIALAQLTNSVSIPADFLNPSTEYRCIITFSRITSLPADPAGLNAPKDVAYEMVTIVDFTTSGCPLTADLNGDGVVNGADLGLLLGKWGTDGVF
ncbi:MAG: hypothetical protein ACF8GE_03650 [Phycisphaerales bacterium JB043]